MATVIGRSGMTVELSSREVELIREALTYSVRNNTGWEPPEDSEATELAKVFAA